MKILSSIVLLIALSSCAGGWTEDDKKQQRNGCMEQARGQISEEMANKYCDCFLEELVTTYPVFNDFMDHIQSDTIERMKASCRHEIGLP
jgi:hypothetical protein